MNFITSNKIISIDELWRFFNSSTSLLCIAGTDGYLKYTNPSFTRLLGFSEEELISKEFAEFVHADDLKLTKRKMNGIKVGATVSFTNRCKTISGGVKWFAWSMTCPINNGLIYATAHDCSDQHEIEVQLNQEKRNMKKNIAEATLNGQEIEKIEIGKELHDNICQMLTTVKLYHEMALSNKGMSEEFIRKGTDILMESIQEIRQLSKTMVSPGENDFCLTDSTGELIETIMESKKIKITFQDDHKARDLDSKLKLTLFRIIQEQLNNIIKHAQANQVFVGISRDETNVNLIIRDDGIGFDPNKKAKGIGLKNIFSRTRLYNGKVSIKAAPGKGCSLSVAIPFELNKMVA